MRRDVTSPCSFAPRGLAGQGELGGEILLRLGHQVLRLDLGPANGVLVRARLLGAAEQLVCVDGAEPGRDARLQVGEADGLLHQPAQASLRDVVARVDGDLGSEVGVQQVLALEQLVQPLDHAVEVGVEAAGVHELAQRGDVAGDLLDPGVHLRASPAPGRRE